MAFSTQKDFFHVPFMNETAELECKKACVKLKSYESSLDYRSWARDKTKQSKFLEDLVTCQLPVSIKENFNFFLKILIMPPVQLQLPNLSAGDSLLQCANIHLADYQKLMNIKDSLENQLQISNERLQTSNNENLKIKEILTTKLDSNTSKDFYNKIQQLTANGKLNKNEENEMLKIQQKIENLQKAYEIFQAENNYLRRLIEKLSLRATITDLPSTDNETSNDIKYLQKEINSLRKECKLLRGIEDDYLRKKFDVGGQPTTITDEDAKNIKMIIEERNDLRKKCKSLQTLESKVVELQNKTQAQGSNLEAQGSYINQMETEMEKCHAYYKNELQQIGFREKCLKEQLKDLQNELIMAKCQLQKMESQQMELCGLRNELAKRDLALHDYDCQYQQLMGVVKEFQALKLQGLQDNQTQTCQDMLDDLAFFTHATLEEIMNELKRRGCSKDQYESAVQASGLAHRMGGVSTNEEISHLQHELERIKAERDNMCSEALRRLQELEAENECLKQDNCQLRESTKDADDKLSKMLKKVEHLDGELNQNKDELRKSVHELSEAKRLVEDISSVQLQNLQLANAVGAINSRDDEKIIDDLRRQLDDEMAKLKACQAENQKLGKQVNERDKE
ncbi:centrosomal protein of 112 kDa, partial [Musca vetustissima]|uniref:centrosomal protein of 112 kDa n=1 Tax=Musca vetustissima TaxID=27455 RepID=UPI002AB7318F